MGTIEYYGDINLKGYEIKNVVVDKVSTLPTGKLGQIVFLDTAAADLPIGMYVYSSDGWKRLGDAGSVDAVAGRVTTLEGKMTTAEGNIATNASDIDAVEGRLDTAESDITALDGRLDTAESGITTLNGKMTTAEGKITTLETTVGDASAGLVKDVADLKNTVGDSTSGLVKDVDALETRVGMDDNSGLSKRIHDVENAGYITKAVNDLENYYLSSNTYSRSQIDNLIAGVTQFQLELVNELPTTGQKANVIYLVPSTNSQDQNVKDEFIWINNGWEQIGSTAFSLNIAQGNDSIVINSTTLQTASATQIGLLSKTDFATFAGKQDALTFDPAPTADSQNVVKSGAIATALAGKQDSVTGAATTIVANNLTASKALVSDAQGKVASSEVTATELGTLAGMTGTVVGALAGKVDVDAGTAAHTGYVKVNTNAQGLVTGGADTIASTDVSDFNSAVLTVIKSTASKVIATGDIGTAGKTINHTFGEMPSSVTIYSSTGNIIYAQTVVTDTNVVITPSETITGATVVIKL